jgi:peptidoglycan/LPS O-acetylase OafA/YrhL
MEMKANRVISYLSEISYSFFIAQLFNWPIMKKMVELFGIDDNLFKIVSSFAVCLLLAVIIHEMIEKPSKRLLGRFMK